MKKLLLIASVIFMAFASIAQTWTKTSTFTNPVNSHSLTTLANGDVLQVAGDSGFNVYINDVYLYSVINDVWTEVAGYPTNIKNHVAFSTSDTEVIVIGGSVDGASTDQVYSYNTETDAWTAKASMPKALESLAAVKLDDGRIFVTGGWTLPATVANADAYVYDATTDSWTTLASMPEGLANTACALLGNGDIVVAGGLTPSFSTVASSYVYNFENDAWTTVGDIPYALSGGAMCASLSNGSAVLVGGFDFLTGSYKDKVLVYDVAEQVWNELLTLDFEISNGVVTEVEEGKILIAAGNNGAKNSLSNEMSIALLNGLMQESNKASLSAAYIVDIEAATITAEDDMPEPRQAAKYTVLNDGRILITGGAGAFLADDTYNDGVIYEKSVAEVVVDVTFTIVDENESALELASIIFNTDTLTTDVNGEAVFSAVSGTTLGYTVLLEGYNTVVVADTDEEAIIVDEENITKTVVLTPIEYTTVAFTIVDENDAAVEGASVSFNGETLQSTADGLASFEVLPGVTLGYSVIMAGYDTVMVADTDTEAIVVGDEDVATTVKLTPTVGINEIASSFDINIYPSVSNGNITVEAGTGYALTLKLINQQGQLVKTINNIEGTQNINLDVNKGLYIVVSEVNNQMVQSQKLIVQ